MLKRPKKRLWTHAIRKNRRFETIPPSESKSIYISIKIEKIFLFEKFKDYFFLKWVLVGKKFFLTRFKRKTDWFIFLFLFAKKKSFTLFICVKRNRTKKIASKKMFGGGWEVGFGNDESFFSIWKGLFWWQCLVTLIHLTFSLRPWIFFPLSVSSFSSSGRKKFLKKFVFASFQTQREKKHNDLLTQASSFQIK